MLGSQTACNEAFEAKAIKDLKTAISKTMESDLTKECEATMSMLKFKGVMV